MTAREIVNDRMFMLMDYCLSVGQCDNQSDFLNKIGANPQNAHAYKTGKSGFTVEHIHKAATFFGADTNYLFGLSSKMIAQQKSSSELDRFEQAFAELKAALKRPHAQ